MKKYEVHFEGFYGYDIEVEAENEEVARNKAEILFDEADANEFMFIPNGVDVMEED